MIKIKEIIRRKMINFLLIDKLNNDISYFYRMDATNKNKLEEVTAKINTLQKTVENAISIGTDISPKYSDYSRSWAVVCVEGKINVVKFVELSSADSRSVMNFLKQFDGSRRVIDCFPSKDLFEDGLLF